VAFVIILVIEASTYAGSVALIGDGLVLAERSVAMRGLEREALMPAVAEVLADGAVPAARLERIVCGAGPGSFTSLRIAGGIAKGIALATGALLVPVSSLAILVASRDVLPPGRYLGAIDALRGEHYVAAFVVTEDGALRAEAGASLIASAEIEAHARRLGATLVTAGTTSTSAIVPHARAASRITKLIGATPAADLAGWEPAYGRLAEAQVKWEEAHGRSLAGA
jgi:tRNA threonylcarbamoyladenosine biosynthesis protein TsaB